jgi:F-type H+-transporting ATPase subunit alpha
LNSVPVEDVARFEREVLEHVKAAHEDVLNDIRERQEAAEEAQERLNDIINDSRRASRPPTVAPSS